MEPARIVICTVFLALSIGSFLISYFHFHEKGYLFNNAYLWASPEERERMDQKDKKPYYRQSGFAFLLIGIIFILMTVYTAADWLWALFALVLVIILAIVYAVVSSVKMERRQ